MADFLPRDSKGRIQIRVWFGLIWLLGMVLIITGSFLILGGSAAGGGDDFARGMRLGIGAAQLSLLIAAISAGVIWFKRRR
jgi:hypothetical protein